MIPRAIYDLIFTIDDKVHFAYSKVRGSYIFLIQDESGMVKEQPLIKEVFKILNISPNYIDKYIYQFIQNKRDILLHSNGVMIDFSCEINNYHIKDGFLFIHTSFQGGDGKYPQLPVVFVFDKNGILGHFVEIDDSVPKDVFDAMIHDFRTSYFRFVLRDSYFSYIPSVLIYDNGFLVRIIDGTLLRFKGNTFKNSLIDVSLRDSSDYFSDDVEKLILPNINLRGKVHYLSFSWINENKATNFALILESLLKKSNISTFDLSYVLQYLIYHSGNRSILSDSGVLLFDRERNRFYFFSNLPRSVVYFSIDVKNMSLSDYCVVKVDDYATIGENNNREVQLLSDFSKNGGEKYKDISFNIAKNKKSFEKALRITSLYKNVDELHCNDDNVYKLTEFVDFLQTRHPVILSADNFFKRLLDNIDRPSDLANTFKVFSSFIMPNYLIHDEEPYFFDVDENSFVFSFFDMFQIEDNDFMYDNDYKARLLNLFLDYSYIDYIIVKSKDKRISLFNYLDDYISKINMSFDLPMFFYKDHLFANVFVVKYPDGIRLYKFQMVDDYVNNKFTIKIIPSQDFYTSYGDVYSALTSHSIVWDEDRPLDQTYYVSSLSVNSRALRYKEIKDVIHKFYKEIGRQIVPRNIKEVFESDALTTDLEREQEVKP